MEFVPDRFYLDNAAVFLQLVRILKADQEFRMALDFGKSCLQLESMLLSGVVGVGVQLVQCVGGIVRPSLLTRRDRVVLRVDSGALYQTVVALNHVPYTYLSLGLTADDVGLCVSTYAAEHVVLGTGTVQTLDLAEQDADFLVTADALQLHYPLCLEHPGHTFKKYLSTGTIDTVLHYRPLSRSMTWVTSNQQTRIELYMTVSSQCQDEVRICLLPAVTGLVQQFLQVAAQLPTQLALSNDLPVRLWIPLDRHGSFIRVYAGTKDDLA